MRGDFESGEKRRRKRRGAILSAAVVLVYAVPLAMLMFWLAVAVARRGSIGGMAVFLVAYGLLGGGVVWGVVRALQERLEEIEGGEEEDAERY